MIIDSLTHITSDGKWFDTTLDAGWTRLEKNMAAVGVEKSVVSGLPTLDDALVILETAKKHPHTVIPVAAFSQDQSRSLKEQIETIKDQGFAGIKIHSRLLKISLEDSLLDEVLSLCGKLGLVVYLCTMIKHPAPLPKRPLPYIIGDLCSRHKETKIVLAHGGYNEILAVSEQVRGFENVLLDLSCTLLRFETSSLGQDISFLVKTFDRRLCLGSDFPEATFADVLGAMQRLGFAKETLDNKGILGNNIWALFNS